MVALAFDTIHSTALSLAPKISAMEYNGIMEALMLASNSWCDAVKQSAFIRTLINNAEWQEISTICDSLQTFTSILPENVFYEKRLLFIRNLSVVNSTLKRIKKTAKILQQNQNANNSGVAINGNGANDLDATHPAYDHVVPILSVVLKLVKCLHTLPESSELKFLMEMSEAEKSMVLGIHMGYGTASSFDKGAAALGELNPVDVEKSHAEKLRVRFFQTIFFSLTLFLFGNEPLTNNYYWESRFSSSPFWKWLMEFWEKVLILYHRGFFSYPKLEMRLLVLWVTITNFWMIFAYETLFVVCSSHSF